MWLIDISVDEDWNDIVNVSNNSCQWDVSIMILSKLLLFQRKLDNPLEVLG